MAYYIDSQGNLRVRDEEFPDAAYYGSSPTATDPSGRGPEPTREVQTSSTSPPDYSNQYNRPARDFPSSATATPFNMGGVAFTQRFQDENGDWTTYTFTWSDLIDAGIMSRLPTTDKEATNLIATAKRRFAGTEPGTDFDDLGIGSSSGGGGGGRGGGGGAAGPEYLSPNREEVAEQLKSYVVATTGKNDPDLLDKAVDAYMAADKEAWQMQVDGKGGEQPSPFMAAKEIVRATDAYKTIHYLRPDSVDEMDWVTGTQGKLRQLGISAGRAEELGIAQAKGGSSDDELIASAETDKLTRNKVMADSQRRRIQDAARSVAGILK